MEYIVVALTSFLIAGLTLFSGFGLGTVLMPVFAMFFSMPIAISLTAIVHFFNNIFKLFLLAKKANKEIVFMFGITAIIGAAIGAKLLSYIAEKSFIVHYQIFNQSFSVEFLNLILGLIILFFAVFEIIPYLNKLQFDKKFLPAGGILSGFFGGLSGHQGAFRSIFLLKTGLSKEQFIATGVVLAILVDITRLFVYGTILVTPEILQNYKLLIIAVLSAFLGSFLAKKFLHKVTIGSIRAIIFILLLIISVGLIIGKI